MDICTRYMQEAKEIWGNYCPIRTEASSFLDFGGAVISLAAICRTQNSLDLGFDFVFTPQMCMCESALLFARGLTKLAVPIIAGSAYLGYQSFN